MDLFVVLEVTTAHKSFITALKVADEWLGSSLNIKDLQGNRLTWLRS